MKTDDKNIDKQLSLVKIADEIEAAQKIIKAMGLKGGDATLRLNKMVFDYIGVDCMALLNMTEKDARKYDIVKGQTIFNSFFNECCQFIDDADLGLSERSTTIKNLYLAYESWCINTGSRTIGKALFKRCFLADYMEKPVGRTQTRKIVGVSIKEKYRGLIEEYQGLI